MRPRPLGHPLATPPSPGPLGSLTYRAQTDPKRLRAAAWPSQAAPWRARARGGPSVQEHFFGRHDTRYSVAASGLLAQRSGSGAHALALSAGGDCPGPALPNSHSQLAGAGHAPATCPRPEGVRLANRAAVPPC